MWALTALPASQRLGLRHMDCAADCRCSAAFIAQFRILLLLVLFRTRQCCHALSLPFSFLRSLRALFCFLALRQQIVAQSALATFGFDVDVDVDVAVDVGVGVVAVFIHTFNGVAN